MLVVGTGQPIEGGRLSDVLLGPIRELGVLPDHLANQAARSRYASQGRPCMRASARLSPWLSLIRDALRANPHLTRTA